MKPVRHEEIQRKKTKDKVSRMDSKNRKTSKVGTWRDKKKKNKEDGKPGRKKWKKQEQGQKKIIKIVTHQCRQKT